MVTLTIFFAPLLWIVFARGALLPFTDLEIVNMQISPDGFARSSVVAGGTFPGPLLTSFKGIPFRVNVKNKLTDHSMLETTSIHFHGLFQEGTSWSDGVAFVSQCPIAAGHSFPYQFAVPDQAGTFWYHSHLKNQYCDGLRGPVVIYDPQDPMKYMYDFDDESTIITLGDWFHYKGTAEQRINIPDSNLINGKGRYLGGPASPLSVVSVRPRRRYRFRLINMACVANYIFSIDGHNFTVIEADGVTTQPVTVDSLQIFVGQRYSVVLNADQPVENYWIRAMPNLGNTTFDGGLNSAILRYDGAPGTDPKSVQTNSTQRLVETSLKNYANKPAPGAPNAGGADIQLNMNVTFDRNTGLFAINGNSFVEPPTPVLLQILSGARTVQSLVPAGGYISLPPNKVVEITFQINAFGGPHPFHLHGHNFAVVQSAGSHTFDYDNPVIRDVVSTGNIGDTTIIRFDTNNPGPWVLHCHINFHLNNGMSVIFAEDSEDVRKRRDVFPFQEPSQDWKDLCPIYNSLSPDQL